MLLPLDAHTHIDSARGPEDLANAGGAGWAASSRGLTISWVWSLAIDPSNPQTLYASTGAGVFKSTNGGANWAASSRGLMDSHVLCLAFGPLGILYAGTEGNGVFRIDPQQ